MLPSIRKIQIASEYSALTSSSPKLRAKAFADLVKATTPREVNYLRSRHSSLPDHLLQEIVGETFRGLWAKIEAGDAEWAQKWTWGYFRGALKFRGLTEYKKRKRAGDRFGEHQSKPVTTADDLEIYGAAQPRLAEREAQANALKAVASVIGKLPLQQRRVAEILRDNRDGKIGPGEVIQLYRQEHRATLTTAAAKSSLAVVRAKLRAALAESSQIG